MDRRTALRSRLPTESMVILSAATAKQMTDVVPYPFRQDADYLYYTGCQQPGGIAVLDDHADLCMFMPDRDLEVRVLLFKSRDVHLVDPDDFLQVVVREFLNEL